MRQPQRLLRELGPMGFLAFQLVVGGNVLAALVHPFFLAGLVVLLTQGLPAGLLDDATMAALTILYGVSVFVGYFASTLLGWIGLKRRGLLPAAWILLLMPLNWLLLSLAAWRALYQLAVAPYKWEKTEHGLAKSSRRADTRVRSLIALERHQEAGNLPPLSDDTAWRPFRGRSATARISRATRARHPTFDRPGSDGRRFRFYRRVVLDL